VIVISPSKATNDFHFLDSSTVSGAGLGSTGSGDPPRIGGERGIGSSSSAAAKAKLLRASPLIPATSEATVFIALSDTATASNPITGSNHAGYGP